MSYRPWDDPEYEEDDWEPDPDVLYEEWRDKHPNMDYLTYRKRQIERPGEDPETGMRWED